MTIGPGPRIRVSIANDGAMEIYTPNGDPEGFRTAVIEDPLYIAEIRETYSRLDEASGEAYLAGVCIGMGVWAWADHDNPNGRIEVSAVRARPIEAGGSPCG